MMQDQRQTDDSKRILILLLAAVLTVGFGVRLWMALRFPRFFDDHFVFNNIAAFLDGSLRPRHSYYGSLSYLPQAVALAVCDFLHSVTGIDALAVHGRHFEGFTLGAFRIMRLFVVGYALVSILMAYLVGRRLFSPRVGVLAAAVLAAYPQHVRSAVQLKPDMMALMFTLIALYWTAAAARDPRLSRYLLCGVGVGLAASAKYIGLASALPVTAWALWAGFRDRRQWAWLVLAGVTSAITFFSLNPFFKSVFYYGTRLLQFHENLARVKRSDHWVVLRRQLEFVATQHGWILGVFLLLGTALLIRQLWCQPANERRMAALLPLSLFLGYLAVHAAGMVLFYGHNLLPGLGGAALVCAYGIDRSWQGLARHRAAWRAPMATGLAGLLIAFLLVRPVNYVYGRLVPGTWSIAEKTLRKGLKPVRTRQVAHESERALLGLSEGWQSAARTPVPSLASLSPAFLDLTDAEVFPLSRTAGAQAAFYETRRRRLAGNCVLEIRPRPFRSRGTPLVLLLHPWTPKGKAIPIGVERIGRPPRNLIARLPVDLAAGEVLSIELFRPAKMPIQAVLLQPGNRSLPLQYGGRRRESIRFLTPRFRYAAGTAEIHLPASGRAHPKSFRLQIRRWTPPPCP